MLRIAHISDLHIRDDRVNNDRTGILDAAARALLASLNIHVEAGGHDQVKLDALVVRLKALSPQVVAITGDITNFGDKASFELASRFIEMVKGLPSKPEILCVPGNHDALAERAAIASKRSGLCQRVAFKIAKLFSPEVKTAERAGFEDYFLNSWRPQANVELLQNYDDFCHKNKLRKCDPSIPVDIDLAWGTVRFFLFNSVNGPGLMANKGLIGAGQMQKAADALEMPSPDSHDGVVRIALLHHHPVRDALIYGRDHAPRSRFAAL